MTLWRRSPKYSLGQMSCLFQEETPEMKVLVCSQPLFHVGNNISAPRQHSQQSCGNFVPKTEAVLPLGTRSCKPVYPVSFCTPLISSHEWGTKFPLVIGPSQSHWPALCTLLAPCTCNHLEWFGPLVCHGTKQAEWLRSERQPLTADRLPLYPGRSTESCQTKFPWSWKRLSPAQSN